MPTLLHNDLTSLYERSGSRERSAAFEAIKWPEDMAPSRSPIHFTNELQVAAPPETIWSLLVDPEAWPRFYPGVEHVQLLDGHKSLRPNVRALAPKQQPFVERLSRRLHFISPQQARLSNFNFNTDTGGLMSYAIIGAGAVAQALDKMFARKQIAVAIASRRSPEALTPVAKAIGATIIPQSMQDAVKADMVLLAVPFGAQKEVVKAAESWQGKIVIDVTNAYGVSPEELGNLPSSVAISQTFSGATLVKAFNHLPAEILAEDPNFKGGRRVVFLSSDNDDAAAQVATLVEELGFAPVKLGKLAEGGLLVQARGKTWAPLIFQDLFKKGDKNV